MANNAITRITAPIPPASDDDVFYAIVTGAGSGLGRAIALRLARDHWTVCLVDLDAAANAATLAAVRQAGGAGHTEMMDVADSDAWARLEHDLKSLWPRLDLLVNNAGVCGSGEIGQENIADWPWMFRVNVFGVAYGCHTFVGWLKANSRGGHIINTASLAGICAAPTLSAYNASKAAVLALSETLYAELKQHKIGVTVLCPAFFPTNLLRNGHFASDVQKHVGENSMRKANFTADDVANAAVRAMQRKQLYVFLPFKARLYWMLKRFIPRIFLRVLAHAYSKGLPDSI